MVKQKIIKKRPQEKKSQNRQDFKMKKKVDEAIVKAINDFDEVFLKLGKE